MARPLVLAYGIAAYLLFVGTFIHAVGFLANIWGARFTADDTVRAPLTALVVNFSLLMFFALQHSGMARRGFKNWATRYVPHAIERSTYVLAACLAMGLLFWQWRPLPGIVWDVQDPATRRWIWVLYAAGWTLVGAGCFMCNHLHLFGLGQVIAYFRGHDYVQPMFRMSMVYRYVRHPLMLGFLITFWSAPTMTSGRLLLAGVSTLYILIAIRLEERDLIVTIGKSYARYMRQTSSLIPRPWRRVPRTARTSAAEAR